MTSPHPTPLADELDRRLAIITDPSYVDPARRDLDVTDYVLLALLNVTIVSIMLWYSWG